MEKVLESILNVITHPAFSWPVLSLLISGLGIWILTYFVAALLDYTSYQKDSQPLRQKYHAYKHKYPDFSATFSHSVNSRIALSKSPA